MSADTEKPGCRECGNQYYHRVDCPRWIKSDNPTPVTDGQLTHPKKRRAKLTQDFHRESEERLNGIERKDFGSMAQATTESLEAGQMPFAGICSIIRRSDLPDIEYAHLAPIRAALDRINKTNECGDYFYVRKSDWEALVAAVKGTAQ